MSSFFSFNALDWIWDFFRAPKKVPIVSTPSIRYSQVAALLTPYTKNIWISDDEFKTIDTENLKDFLKTNPVDGRRYITEAHDCDDYSYELMGDVSDWNPAGAFGIVWGNRAADGAPHAWNFYVDSNNQIMYVEPQTDEIFFPTIENIWIMIC